MSNSLFSLNNYTKIREITLCSVKQEKENLLLIKATRFLSNPSSYTIVTFHASLSAGAQAWSIQSAMPAAGIQYNIFFSTVMRQKLKNKQLKNKLDFFTLITDRRSFCHKILYFLEAELTFFGKNYVWPFLESFGNLKIHTQKMTQNKGKTPFKNVTRV
jgi:hypothetical protein